MFLKAGTGLIASLGILLFCAGPGLIKGPAIEVHFTDITEKAGINFRHVSSPEKKYIVE